MNLEQRTAALLAVVEDDRQQRCAALLLPARAQAQAALAAALREARRRVRTALAEERKRSAAALGAAEAQLATDTRLLAQRRAARQLAQGWLALRQALQARWDEPATRAAWIDTHLARARTVLGGAACTSADVPAPGERGAAPGTASVWQLQGPPQWPATERAQVAATLRAQGAPAVHDAVDATLSAGFRVQAGHNVLDATLDGLLADRSAVQGRLLQLLEGP